MGRGGKRGGECAKQGGDTGAAAQAGGHRGLTWGNNKASQEVKEEGCDTRKPDYTTTHQAGMVAPVRANGPQRPTGGMQRRLRRMQHLRFAWVGVVAATPEGLPEGDGVGEPEADGEGVDDTAGGEGRSLPRMTGWGSRRRWEMSRIACCAGHPLPSSGQGREGSRWE